MTTWADLPPEIVEQILKPLDNDNLVFKISCVDRRLHSLAFKEYLRRRGVTESGNICIASSNVPIVLRALRAADWIKNVPYLGVDLHFSHSIFPKIHGLARFVRGLDSLGSLTLYISKHWSPKALTSSKKALEWRDPWWECCRALLNAALSKGVKKLRIEEWEPDLVPKYINMDHCSEARLRWGLRHSIKNGWTKIRSCVRLASDGNSKDSISCLCATCSADADDKARICDVQLSPMLLSPLFFRDTFGILRANVSTIHTINIGAVSLPLVCQDGTWDRLFGRLQFPLLYKFTFIGLSKDNPWESGAPIETLLSFLGRHPTISDLRLENMPWGVTPELTFTREAPSLPNLTYLVARNDIAAHILQRPENCKRLGVQLLSLPYRPWYPGLPGPRPAMTALASNSSSILRPIYTVEVNLDTAGDCLDGDTAGDDDGRSLTTPQTFKVGGLEILLRSDFLFDTKALLNVLPRWLGMFAHLERLEINVEERYRGIGFDAGRWKAPLCAAIVRSCPHLRSLSVDDMKFRSRMN